MPNLTNQIGLSLVELVVATAVGGVIILGAGEAIYKFNGNSRKLTSKTFTDINNATLTKNFSAVMQSAGIAAQFEHLPISLKNCPQGSADTVSVPCLRQLDSNNTFVSVNPNEVTLVNNGVNPSKIEFFRDDDAAIGTTQIQGNLGTPILQGSKPLVLSDTAVSSNYYTTWPLVDNTSPPFVVLSNSGVTLSFVYDSSTHTSAKTPISSNMPYSFFMSKQQLSSQTLASLEGTIFLIYNAFNTQHYYFQLVGSQALDCSVASSSTHKSQCAPYIYWTNDKTETTKINKRFSSPLVSTALGGNNGNYEYAFKLLPVTTSNHFPNRYVPTRSFLGSASSSDINWNIQTNLDFFLFLTQTPSIYDTSNIDYLSISSSPYQSMDLRFWDHYYTMTGNSSSTQLTAMPVYVKAYYLKKALSTGSSSTTVQYDLMSSTFSEKSSGNIGSLGDPEVMVMAKVPGKVIFARKLGTSNFSIFLYQPKSSQASTTDIHRDDRSNI